MARKVLVSLVSDQTIPNVELIKEFESEIESYVFITTEYMESEKKDRTNCIITAAHLKGVDEKRIVVIEDSITDIEGKLTSNMPSEKQYIVNLTGGTKIMSIAVFNFFQKKNAKIYYKPIRTNKILSVEDDSIFRKITTKIHVKDYLLSYGVKSKSAKSFEIREITQKIFDDFVSGNIDYKVIENLRVSYRSKRNKYSISTIENDEREGYQISSLGAFMVNLGFVGKEKSDAVITKHEIAYLTGGWYEELCYFYFKEQLSLGDDDIQLGVKLEKSDYVLDNDLDVVFIFNNNIYVVECKTAMSKNGKVSTALFNETIYKSSALRAKFGLTVNNMLLTLSSMAHKNIDYAERAKVMNIELFGRKYFNGKIDLGELVERIKNTY